MKENEIRGRRTGKQAVKMIPIFAKSSTGARSLFAAFRAHWLTISASLSIWRDDLAIISSQANVIIMKYYLPKERREIMENRTSMNCWMGEKRRELLQKHSIRCSLEQGENLRKKTNKIVETSACNSLLSCSTLLFICSTLHKLFSLLEFCSIAFTHSCHLFFCSQPPLFLLAREVRGTEWPHAPAFQQQNCFLLVAAVLAERWWHFELCCLNFCASASRFFPPDVWLCFIRNGILFLCSGI